MWSIEPVFEKTRTPGVFRRSLERFLVQHREEPGLGLRLEVEEGPVQGLLLLGGELAARFLELPEAVQGLAGPVDQVDGRRLDLGEAHLGELVVAPPVGKYPPRAPLDAKKWLRGLAHHVGRGGMVQQRM